MLKVKWLAPHKLGLRNFCRVYAERSRSEAGSDDCNKEQLLLPSSASGCSAAGLVMFHDRNRNRCQHEEGLAVSSLHV